MNAKPGASRSRTTQSKAAVVSNNSKTLRKQKQAKPSVKLSFKSPLVSRTNIDPCDPDQTKLILDRLSTTFNSNQDGQMRKSLVIGVNAVTKMMETEQTNLRLLVLVKDVTPAVLTEHLPIMACLKQIPCIVLSCSSKKLGQCLKLPVATCFVIIEDGGQDQSAQQIIKPFTQYAKIPTVSWLQKSAPRYQSPELDENHPKRGHKISR